MLIQLLWFNEVQWLDRKLELVCPVIFVHFNTKVCYNAMARTVVNMETN